MSNLLYSLISFSIAVFFILLGLICILLPWSPGMRTNVIQFILENSVTIFLFGFGFMMIGIFIVINILLSARRQYYQIQSDTNPVLVDESLIQEYVNGYWKELFPEAEIPSRLTLKQNKIHVQADLPYLSEPQQEILLERIKKDLKDLFGRILGYQEPFYLSISFHAAGKQKH